ncbi:hypothetical protein ACI79D_03150 [Geodermatophilus sp. SYSU D00708]
MHTPATGRSCGTDPSVNVSMAVAVLAIGAGGALTPLETTVPMTVDETMDPMRRAQQIGSPPMGSQRSR